MARIAGLATGVQAVEELLAAGGRCEALRHPRSYYVSAGVV